MGWGKIYNILCFLFNLKNDNNLDVQLDLYFFILVGWGKIYNILCIFLFKLKNDNDLNV